MTDVLLFVAVLAGWFTGWLGLSCLLWHLWWKYGECRKPPFTFWQGVTGQKSPRLEGNGREQQ